tara:strand:+ start:2222 stop:2455 length:234 start_codon:yes stop_codon:yes gene_type:complete
MEKFDVLIEWKQLSLPDLGTFVLTQEDIDDLEYEYGATFYFSLYDYSNERPLSYDEMSDILDDALFEAGLLEDYKTT